MPKTTITENERLKLIGLLTLAAQHNKAMEDIKDAALAITDERDSDGALETCGHTTDALWNDYSVDMLLRKLGMDVAPNAAPEPPCDRDLLRSLKAIVEYDPDHGPSHSGTRDNYEWRGRAPRVWEAARVAISRAEAQVAKAREIGCANADPFCADGETKRLPGLPRCVCGGTTCLGHTPSFPNSNSG
jgi:hypothetical protein